MIWRFPWQYPACKIRMAAAGLEVPNLLLLLLFSRLCCLSVLDSQSSFFSFSNCPLFPPQSFWLLLLSNHLTMAAKHMYLAPSPSCL